MSIIKTLDDGTSYVKAAYLEPEEDVLKGIWTVYRKLDGVRVMRNKAGKVWSRNSKPLYNVDHLEFKDAEFFCEDWNTSVSMVRTESYVKTDQSMIYELTDRQVDNRLYIGKMNNPTWDRLEYYMKLMMEQGDEGLVIRQWSDRKGRYIWLKVVPKKQADVRITGFKEGTGRLYGTLGSILSNHGSVGSGFSDSDREYIWATRADLLGKIMQVEYREVTDAGKLRFPAFVRFRHDKDTEDV